MKNLLKYLIVAVLFVPTLGFSSGSEVVLDNAPINPKDKQSLQRGAQLFANNCLSCHGASLMRYNQLTKIGLTEAQIKDNLILTDAKIGDMMKSSMMSHNMDGKSKEWFGAMPPDLSLVARARGADWLYTYLRTFYKDDSRATGWNNLAFDKVGMPHVLHALQGEQSMQHKSFDDHEEARSFYLELSAPPSSKMFHEEHKDGKTSYSVSWLQLDKAGTLTSLTEDGKPRTQAYDQAAADLVNFLSFMSDPSQTDRKQIGFIILAFLLFVLIPLTYMLKKEYWKDVH